MGPDKKRIAWAVVAVAVVAVSVWTAEKVVERSERTVHVDLRCSGRICRASVDGGPPLVVEIPPDLRSGRFGLYSFQPYEYTAPQYFRGLQIDTGRGAAREIRLALTAPSHLALFDADGDWRVDPNRGMTHEGPLREFSVASLAMPPAGDFWLEVALDSPIDAGVLVRAADPRNGLLLIVRQFYNDFFFCRLENDRHGPMLALSSLRPMSAGRESLRLAGSVADVVLVAMLFLGLARLAVRKLPDLVLRSRAVVRFLRQGRPRRGWLVALFVTSFLATAAIAWFALGGIPHINDGVAYLFQAKVFAAGQAWAPVPAGADFFLHEHVIMLGDRWFGKYPPLFPAVLAGGVLAGVPWLVNPLLAALTGLATFLLARELAGWRWASVAWLLLLTSPFYLMLGGSMMSHMTAALFVTLALWSAVRAMRTRSIPSTVVTGLCLGATVLTRPFTALVAAVAIGLFFTYHVVRERGRPRTFVLTALLVATVAPFAGLLLGWNRFLTSPEAPSFNLYTTYNDSDRLGFGPDKGEDWYPTWGTRGHTPAKAARSTQQYLDSTSRHLLGWPFGLSLSLVVASFAWGRKLPTFWLLLGLLALLAAGYSLYWAVLHVGYGPRYWFAAAPGLMVLSALGLRWLVRSARSAAMPVDDEHVVLPAGALCVAMLVAGMVMWNFSVYMPGRWKEMPNYGGISARLKWEIDKRGLHDALVFVPTEGLIYNDGFFMNDPFMNGSLVFARDLGPRNRELIERYPSRQVFVWNKEELVRIVHPAGVETAGAEPTAAAGRSENVTTVARNPESTR